MGVFAGQIDRDWIDHAVELDAHHRDHAEKKEEGHQHEEQPEGGSVLIDALVQREIQREDQGDHFEEDAGHQGAGNDLAEPLSAVRNHVVDAEKQEKARSDADDHL